MAEQTTTNVGYKSIKLLKNEVLGEGSYGKVCKAKCDELTCAAKIIHEALVGGGPISRRREHRLPVRRFERECDFLSTIRHPNIVQYLGTYRDDGRLVLLMELLDGNLTSFLEDASGPLPYHKQVDICYDISLALAFLHSNNIVHRDLSGKNALMIGDLRAKVTDFGMATLINLSPALTHPPTSTTCPGTEVYMPPEALQVVAGRNEPEKIDCFSFGVITLQVLTREFPDPGPRSKLIEKWHLLGTNELISEITPETERRKEHIDQINSAHPLRPIFLDCLKDKSIQRPSATQLCERLAKLKQGIRYKESVDPEVKVKKSRSSPTPPRLFQQSFLQESEDYKHNMKVLRRVRDLEGELQRANEQQKKQNDELERMKQKMCKTCALKIDKHISSKQTEDGHEYQYDDYDIIDM